MTKAGINNIVHSFGINCADKQQNGKKCKNLNPIKQDIQWSLENITLILLFGAWCDKSQYFDTRIEIFYFWFLSLVLLLFSILRTSHRTTFQDKLCETTNLLIISSYDKEIQEKEWMGKIRFPLRIQMYIIFRESITSPQLFLPASTFSLTSLCSEQFNNSFRNQVTAKKNYLFIFLNGKLFNVIMGSFIFK